MLSITEGVIDLHKKSICLRTITSQNVVIMNKTKS
jgi:hypothetical protein